MITYSNLSLLFGVMLNKIKNKETKQIVYYTDSLCVFKERMKLMKPLLVRI